MIVFLLIYSRNVNFTFFVPVKYFLKGVFPTIRKKRTYVALCILIMKTFIIFLLKLNSIDLHDFMLKFSQKLDICNICINLNLILFGFVCLYEQIRYI